MVDLIRLVLCLFTALAQTLLIYLLIQFQKPIKRDEKLLEEAKTLLIVTASSKDDNDVEGLVDFIEEFENELMDSR